MTNKIIVLTAALALSLPFFASAATLTGQLDLGATGSDVSSLQTFLAADGNDYPAGLVTGFFGPLTQGGVEMFQAQNNIVSSGDPASTGYGRVGPMTLAAINAQMSGSMTSVTTDTTEGAGKVTNVGTSQPVLSNIAIATTNNSATITWNSNVSANARVMYSQQTPFNYNTAASVSGSINMNSQSVTLSNLQSKTTYYYVVESLDPSGNFSWSQSGQSFQTQ